MCDELDAGLISISLGGLSLALIGSALNVNREFGLDLRSILIVAGVMTTIMGAFKFDLSLEVRTLSNYVKENALSIALLIDGAVVILIGAGRTQHT